MRRHSNIQEPVLSLAPPLYHLASPSTVYGLLQYSWRFLSFLCSQNPFHRNLFEISKTMSFSIQYVLCFLNLFESSQNVPATIRFIWSSFCYILGSLLCLVINSPVAFFNILCILFFNNTRYIFTGGLWHQCSFFPGKTFSQMLTGMALRVALLWGSSQSISHIMTFYLRFLFYFFISIY